MSKMKYVVLALAAISFDAYSECYLRSQTQSKFYGQINEIADTRAVVSDGFRPGEMVCSVTARVVFEGRWHNVQGRYEGPVASTQDMCDAATIIAVRDFLSTRGPKALTDNQVMYCSDEPQIKVRTKVDVGEIVKLSEVELNTQRPDFNDRHGRDCKWFYEDSTKWGRMYRWNGVICQVKHGWQVADKF